MAIDISPLYDAVQQHIPCLVYDGNYSFAPLDYSQLCVVFTLVTAARLTSPRRVRSPSNNPRIVNETWSRVVEYTYQLDIYRQVTVDCTQHSPSLAPPFEIEAFTVVDSINFARARLSRSHGLNVLPPQDISFELTQVTGNIACNRAFVYLTILNESLIKFTSTAPAALCVTPTLQPLRAQPPAPTANHINMIPQGAGDSSRGGSGQKK